MYHTITVLVPGTVLLPALVRKLSLTRTITRTYVPVNEFLTTRTLLRILRINHESEENVEAFTFAGVHPHSSSRSSRSGEKTPKNYLRVGSPGGWEKSRYQVPGTIRLVYGRVSLV
jgi:hypothetical protein